MAFAGLAALAVAVAMGLAITWAPSGVRADNEGISEGSPVECADSSIFDGRSETNVATAPGGFIITRICIEADPHPDALFAISGAGDCANIDDSSRAGNDSLHSPCIDTDGPIDCFTVADLGTQTVTVTSANANCTVAHIDFETQAVPGAPTLDKAHNPIWDTVNAGDPVTWTIDLTNALGQVVDIDDTLPPAFSLNSAFSFNDPGITCTSNFATETVECDGTATVNNPQIRIRGVALTCGSDSANTASGTVGATNVSDTDSAITIENCPGPAPFVDIIALYPTTCAALSLPLPAPVTSVTPGVDYCISGTAGDHVQEDTMTYTSSGVGGETFDLELCFTNSAGFDPCTDPGPGPSPYVIPLESQDSNSFVGNDTDFSFTSCDTSTLTLIFSYDGPTLQSAFDTEVLPCITELGGLRVFKECEPDGAQGSFDLQLRDSQGVAIGGTISIDCDTSHLFSALVPGTYNVTEEDGSPNFTETDNTCVDVTVNPGRPAAECTITNTQDPGGLRVFKECEPDGVQGSFDLQLRDDQGVAIGGTVSVDCDTSHLFAPIPAGIYNVTEEDASPNFTETDNTCVDVTVNPGRPAAECTITNEETENGTIIIIKEVPGSRDGTNFSFSDNIPDCDIGPLDDDGSSSNPSSTPDRTTCTDVPPGQYWVTEDPRSGYKLHDIYCSTEGGNSAPIGRSGDLEDRTAHIDLGPGETVTCVFTNKPRDDDPETGTIRIVKSTQVGTTTTFDFHSVKLGDFSLGANQSRTFSDLAPGLYTIVEGVEPGWNLLNITCDEFFSVSIVERKAVVNLSEGDHITCRFANHPVGQVVETTVIGGATAVRPSLPPRVVRPTPTPDPGAAVETITPPSTGDGGLADERLSVLVLLACAASLAAVTLFLARRPPEGRPRRRE